MAKIKIILTILLLTTFSYRIWQTTGCKQFIGFYFNPLQIKITAEENINLDSNLNRNIARAFHNKVTIGVFESLKAATKTINSDFILDTTGPIGIVLLPASLLILLNKRNKLQFAHLIVIVLLMASSILVGNSKRSFWIVYLAQASFSLWSLGFFGSGKLKVVIYSILIVATIWYFSFNWQLQTFCNEIFFN